MVGLEREEQRHDRVPRVAGDPTHEIPADDPFRTSVRGRVDVRCFIINRRGNRGRVEHANVSGEPGDDEVLVHGGHRSRGDSGVCVHEHFHPVAEAVRVEMLVVAWLRAPPQIEVED